MARKKTKFKDVAKFGGTEELGAVQFNGYNHDTSTVEAQSSMNLEMDQGHGNAAIIRCFTFGMNVKAFQEARPNKQEIFNSHLKGIETALWRDGMKILSEVQPRISFNVEKMQYQVFVGATPMRGHTLTQKPQTLREVVHGV